MAPDVDPEAARPATLTWSLVIPVKVLAQAKSRLTGLAGQRRSDFALAMAADTLAAAVQRGQRRRRPGRHRRPGCQRHRVPPRRGRARGHARRRAQRGARARCRLLGGDRWPDRGRAGLAGDLPAVKPAELTAALAAAAPLGTAFVPDADGTGTTLYAAAPGAQFSPRFGPASRDRHLATGAVEIGIDLPGLRRDVDTIEDLRAAIEDRTRPANTQALLASGGMDVELLGL